MEEFNSDNEEKEDKKFDFGEKKKFKIENWWKVLTYTLGVILIVSVFTSGFRFGNNITGMVTGASAGDIALDYINKNLLSAGQTVQLADIKEESGVYVLKLKVNGQEYTSYISKDGKLLFITGVDMSLKLEDIQQQETKEIPKTDKPNVELFVMSHCPYGTQVEKGILPIIKALGNKISFNIRFVYYAMHGETEVKEQLNQYCIQTEQNEKYLSYLECFLKEGKGENCLKEVGIDIRKLTSCTTRADKEFEITKNLNDKASWLNGKYPLFNIDKDLNTKYGVGGSPTLIINGIEAQTNRDPASMAKTICGAFKTQPSECSQAFSSATPAAGFGTSTTTSTNNAAQCE